MDAFDAYTILETIAEINGFKHNLFLVEMSEEEKEADLKAEEIVRLAKTVITLKILNLHLV